MKHKNAVIISLENDATALNEKIEKVSIELQCATRREKHLQQQIASMEAKQEVSKYEEESVQAPLKESPKVLSKCNTTDSHAVQYLSFSIFL